MLSEANQLGPPFLLLLLFATLPCLPSTAAKSADCAKVIRVATNGTDGPACLQGNGSCETLHFVFTNCTITNSTQFLIGPGTFRLSHDLGTIYSTPLSRLEGLAVYGSGAEETVVDCSDACGLAFVNMTNLTISDLTLFNCSQSRPSTSIGKVSELHTVSFEVGLYIWRCRDVVIENVHINETIGVGLVLYETGGRVSITSSVFHHNGIPENMPDTLYGGGGVNIEFPYCPPGHYDDECGNELSGAEYSISNCYFTNNTARLGMEYSEQFITPERSIHQSFGRGGGMAIYFSGNSSDNNVSLSDCHFVGNRAVFGGGLLGEFNDRAQNNNLKLFHCHFIENACFHSSQVNGAGGGVRLGFLLYEANSVADNEIYIEHPSFKQNNAYLGGGVSFVTGYEQGVLASTNRLVMMSPVFLSNIARLGSAVNLMPWNMPSTGLFAKVEILNSVFANNSVLYSNDPWHLMGFGTVYSYKVPFDINEGRTLFLTNNGSGIVVVGTGVNVRSGAAISFLYNVATNGGAIAAYANGWIMLWNDTTLDFIANRAQSRGGAIYSESTGGHQIVESRDCMIRYFEWWRPYEEWHSQLYFEGNFAHETGDDIFTTSLIPCIRSGSNGSAETSIEARKKVFHATPPFNYSGNLTRNSIVTGAAEIKFWVNVSNDDLHISVYPGQLFNLTAKIRPVDELGALSQVPFFATTNVSNNSFPAAVVDPNSVYTTGYLQFDANNNVEQGHDNGSNTVELQTISEPALLFSFNVTLSECLPGSYIRFPNKGVSGQCACAHNSEANGYLEGIVCYEHNGGISIYRQTSVWYGKVPSKTHSANISVTAPCPLYCNHTNSMNNLMPINETDPTSGICRGKSHGVLCGTCDYGILINSHTFECCTLEEKQAISAPAAWSIWIGAQLLLTALIVSVILLFDFDVIGGPLCSFVFFSQVVLDLNLQDCTSGQAHAVIEWTEILYAFWSLRFRWLVPGRICASSFSNVLPAISVDYGFAAIPFLLILIVWLFEKCDDKGWCCRCYQRIRSFISQQCFHRFRQQINQRSLLGHGIATCLILTYGDVVSISFFLLTPVQLRVPHGTDPSDVEGGLQRSLYNGDYVYFGYPHYWYGILAIVMLVVIVLPSFILLIARPCWKRIWECRRNARADQEAQPLVQNVEPPQQEKRDLLGHLKDNCRFFVGMWLLYRLAFKFNNAFAPDCTTSFTVQVSIGIFFLVLHAILQPNKEAEYNILDICFFANIILLSSLGMALWASNGQSSDVTNGYTAVLAVFLILPLLYFVCVLVYRVANCFYGRRCCGRQNQLQQNPAEQQNQAKQPSLYDNVRDVLRRRVEQCG